MLKKKLDIIYEDKYIIAVNKETKLLTVSTLKEKDKTLYNEVSSYVKKKHKSNKIFIVHRLDRDTSGVIVFAKDMKVKKILQDNWDEYAILRNYIGLVKGHINPIKCKLVNKIVESKNNNVYIDDKSKFGKKAITNYELIKYVGDDSLININIETGRKNQIRLQLLNIGFPLVGDTKFTKNKSHYNRLMLHADKLTLIHPITKEKLDLIARVPKEFNL